MNAENGSQQMEEPANKTTREQIITFALDQMVKGESAEQVLSLLRTHFEERTAQLMLNDAMKDLTE